jgi:hypothetical protein
MAGRRVAVVYARIRRGSLALVSVSASSAATPGACDTFSER